MNILFYNDIPFNPLFGGIERVTDIIAKGLLAYDKRYKIYYIFNKVNNPIMLHYDFPVKTFELPYDGGLGEHKNIDYFLKVLEDYNIDIVVNQRGASSWCNPAMKRVTSAKVVSVIHSIVDYELIRSLYLHRNSYNKSLLGYVKFRLKRTCPNLLKIYVRGKIVPKLEAHYRELVEISDAVVVLSKQYINDLKAYLDISKTNVYAISNPNTFESSLVDFSTKNKTILFVGRLDPVEKVPMRLLQIWRKIYKKHHDWSLVIVGSGPAEQQMKEYVNKYNLLRVSFEGSRSNVEDYYKQSSVLCLTSNFEGWPMALTEGMTFGCVPICFKSFGSASEIIDDGENGCIIPAFNLKQYARSLSEVMSDDKKRFALGKAAQEKVKQFSAENIVKQWDELFHKLVEC